MVPIYPAMAQHSAPVPQKQQQAGGGQHQHVPHGGQHGAQGGVGQGEKNK